MLETDAHSYATEHRARMSWYKRLGYAFLALAAVVTLFGLKALEHDATPAASVSESLQYVAAEAPAQKCPKGYCGNCWNANIPRPINPSTGTCTVHDVRR